MGLWEGGPGVKHRLCLKPPLAHSSRPISGWRVAQNRLPPAPSKALAAASCCWNTHPPPLA